MVAELDALLSGMFRAGASSLMVKVGSPPLYRVQGSLVPSEEEPFGEKEVKFLLEDLPSPEEKEKLLREGQVDLVVEDSEGRRFGAHIFRHSQGLGGVFHPIPDEVPAPEELGLPACVVSLAHRPSGVTLLAGPTGSGKTTTLAALVAEAARAGRHVVCVEDPIEYLHTENGPGLVHQREVGIHVESMAAGAREALLLGADVLMVGEVQDRETVQAVLEAANAGILVFAAVSSARTVSALEKFLDLVPEDQAELARTILSWHLNGVVAQALLRRRYGTGLVLAVEVLLASPSVKEALRRGNLQDLPALMRRGKGLGMCSMEASLEKLLARKVITRDEAWMLTREGEKEGAPL